MTLRRGDDQITPGNDSPPKSKRVVVASIIIACCILSSLPRHMRTFDTNSTNEADGVSPTSYSSRTIHHYLSKKRGGNNAIIYEDVPGFRSASGAFPGARMWYDHWTYASRKGRGDDDDQQLNSDRRVHMHDDYVASTAKLASGAALEHIDAMRRRYEEVGALPDFHARGLGWILDRLGMVLTVIVAGNFASSNHIDDAGTLPLLSGPASIFVVDTIGNTKCGGKEDTWIERHPPLTIWVRANGPQIFSGTAMPHKLMSSYDKDNHRCAWRYDFDASALGDYSVHVKAVMFQGFDNIDERCKMVPIPSRNYQFDTQKANKTLEGDLERLESKNYDFVVDMARWGNFSHHRGISGMKMYSPTDSCCEACTRTRNCRMFTFPGALHFDECELYFNEIEQDLDFLDRENGKYVGRARGYSYVNQTVQSFPDIRRRRLVINASEIKKIWPIQNIGVPHKGFPRSGTAAISYFIGCGWSSTLAFENPCHYPSDDLIFGSGKNIVEVVGHPQNLAHAANVIRSCRIEDERLDTANGRWVRYPYPDDSICLPIVPDRAKGFRGFRPMYRGDRPLHCWHREDLTKLANTCAEPGCPWVIKHRWVTDLKKEHNWYGMWESYDCQYEEFGDDRIQQCVDQKRISKIELKGLSIRDVVKSYLTPRLQNIKLTDAGNETLSVVIDTLKLPHQLWHLSIDDYRKQLEDNYPNVTKGSENYWLTGFYYTSEREPYVQVDRSLYYSKVAWDILTPRGYKMINAFDVTAAFAYDTDAQADGMHIVGPPMRAVVTKIFHHLCHDALLSATS